MSKVREKNMKIHQTVGDVEMKINGKWVPCSIKDLYLYFKQQDKFPEDSVFDGKTCISHDLHEYFMHCCMGIGLNVIEKKINSNH